MSYIEFKKKAQEHLSEWIRYKYPDIKDGVYKGKKGVVTHRHILPLEEYAYGKRKEAVIKTIKKYHVLTDGVKLNHEVFPMKELHMLANHLTSSQMLCYNFFRLFLPEDICNDREIEITPELREWLKSLSEKLPDVSEFAKCKFEYKVDDEEGTSFDFCIHDDTSKILFEIKYTEDGFGKAVKDERHRLKFENVYSELLKQQDTVRKNVGFCDFLNDYQLFRNAIRTGKNTYAVIIYPQENISCERELNEFREKWLEHNERIVGMTWEEVFSKSEKSANSELKKKYNF